MEQDVNKVIDNLSGEWAQDMVNAKKRIAVLIEDKRLLEDKVNDLKEEKQSNKAPAEDAK